MSMNAYTVKDFFHGNGNTLSYNEFTTKFNITSNFPFTFYFGIIKAIPRDWKTGINLTENPSNNVLRLINFTNNLRPNKIIYDYLVKPKLTTPRAVFKWEETRNYTINWNRVFRLPYGAVRDTKVQFFQLRFIHRIIGTNSFLHKIKLKDTPLCTFCNFDIETLEHLFWSCRVTQVFWHSICELLFTHNFNITSDYVNFGLCENINSPINFLILHAKYFLYNCKLNGKCPEAQVFLYKFKFLLEVECQVLCKRNDDLRKLRFQETFKIIH